MSSFMNAPFERPLLSLLFRRENKKLNLSKISGVQFTWLSLVGKLLLTLSQDTQQLNNILRIYYATLKSPVGSPSEVAPELCYFCS